MNRFPHICTLRLCAILIVASIGCRGENQDTSPEETADSTTSAERKRVRDFWSHYREATQFRLDGELERAREAYGEALRNNPDHEDALYYLGNVDLALENWEDARARWHRLVELNPASSRAFSQLGSLALCRPGAPVFGLEAARMAFENAHRLNPEETGPTLRLGQVALIENEPVLAANYFDAVTGSNFTSFEAHYLKAYTEWLAGRGDEGLYELNRILTEIENLPAAPVMGEGDTETGKPLSLSQTATCPLFKPFVETMQKMSRPLNREVFLQYEELLRALAAISPNLGERAGAGSIRLDTPSTAA